MGKCRQMRRILGPTWALQQCSPVALQMIHDVDMINVWQARTVCVCTNGWMEDELRKLNFGFGAIGVYNLWGGTFIGHCQICSGLLSRYGCRSKFGTSQVGVDIGSMCLFKHMVVNPGHSRTRWDFPLPRWPSHAARHVDPIRLLRTAIRTEVGWVTQSFTRLPPGAWWDDNGKPCDDQNVAKYWKQWQS